MSSIDHIIRILSETLQIEPSQLDENTALLGNIAEFDSMAVVTVLTCLEDTLGIIVDDDEIDASTFETVSTLVSFVDLKLAA